jgi:hypothetical protein
MDGVSRLGRRLSLAFTAVAIVAIATGGSASAESMKPVRHTYTTDYTSAYGAVSCTGTLVTSAAYPGNATEGGREVEKCVSTEPGGKLTGYFTPGQEYEGYWESDYYATIGEFGVQPTSVLIKVSKSFKSFKVVKAVYAPAAA